MGGKKNRAHNSLNLIPVTSSDKSSTTETLKKMQNQKKTADELLTMTKEQLKLECRKRGQKTNGNKNELLQRLGYKMSNSIKRKDVVMEDDNSGYILTSSNGSSLLMNRIKNNVAISNSYTIDHQKQQQRKKRQEKEERENLVLWRRPLVTLEYSLKECIVLLTTYGKRLLANKKLVVLSMISSLFLYMLMNTNGPHQSLVQATYRKILWCSYWIGLGILSSVGLGTGLHTFLLYLGPHIARVTLAAYECNSINFPEPPYPDDIVCPTTDGDAVSSTYVTIFSIMAKVRLEAMCWGAGTALGELPPYFMARAARLSGIDPDDDDEDLREFEELQQKKAKNKEGLNLIDKGKLFVEEIVQKIGFFGILACASIPNPLFDLAGITCGHFLVPFWTFFGATLIGKAFVKMHIQKMFVIIAFNETLINGALEWLEMVPLIGTRLQSPFRNFLDGQKQRLHKKEAGVGGAASAPNDGKNLLGAIFEMFVLAMVLYFVVSIVNSFAQSYHKRLSKKKALSNVNNGNSKVSKD